jgi:hypothetical protein
VDSPHPRDVNTREEYEALIRASAASDPARPGASPRTG